MLASGAYTVNGDVTADSDATDSASFLAPNSTGTVNISYKRYVKDANFHLIATPVTTQDIAAFASTGVNNVAENGMVLFTVLEPIKMTMQKGLVGYITRNH